jgi:hypothetical protein
MKIVIYEDELYPFYHFDQDTKWNMGYPIIDVEQKDLDRFKRTQEAWEAMQEELSALLVAGYLLKKGKK